MRSLSPFEAAKSVAKQVASAVWRHYIQLIAGVVVLSITHLAFYVFGIRSADVVTIASKQDKFGAHCFAPIVEANLQGNEGFVLADEAIANALICGAATEEKDTPSATLERYVKRYDSCFSYSAASNVLSLYSGNSPDFQSFENEDGKTAIACNCEAGQAKLIATHKTKSSQWCGIDAPDASTM